MWKFKTNSLQSKFASPFAWSAYKRRVVNLFFATHPTFRMSFIWPFEQRELTFHNPHSPWISVRSIQNKNKCSFLEKFMNLSDLKWINYWQWVCALDNHSNDFDCGHQSFVFWCCCVLLFLLSEVNSTHMSVDMQNNKLKLDFAWNIYLSASIYMREAHSIFDLVRHIKVSTLSNIDTMFLHSIQHQKLSISREKNITSF